MEDRTTGLVWQRSTPNVGLTWDAALASCDGLTLAGSSDWRLPTLSELESIVDLGRARPAIDPEVFLDTPSARFWTLSVDWAGRPWAIDFAAGLWDHLPGEQWPRVRCVRQGRPVASGARYSVSADTLVDRTSGLTWQRVITARESRDAGRRAMDQDPGYYPFREAEEYCRALELAGFSDWRLPTLKELMSLLEPGAGLGAPTLDVAAFPATPATPFWSSSPAVLAPGRHLTVSFFDGTAWPNELARVRCVR